MTLAFFLLSAILQQGFEEGTGGWTAFGGGSVRVTQAALDVHGGKAALAFDYEAGKVQAALLPVTPGQLAKLQAVDFWLKTDDATSVAVLLSEKDGGNYSALVWSPKEQWQHIVLYAGDFHLGEGPTDPKDADGRLDLEQVQAVSLLDAGAVLGAALKDAKGPIVIDTHEGKHTLYLDDFRVLDEPATEAADALAIDDFARPFAQWMTLGGMDLAMEPGRLRIGSSGDDEKALAAVRMLPRRHYGEATHVAFELMSEKAANILLCFEKRVPGQAQGPRYNAQVDVPAGRAMVHREVSLSSFTRDEDGPADPDGKLDLDQLKSFAILDITGLETGEVQPNTFRIAKVRFLKK